MQQELETIEKELKWQEWAASHHIDDLVLFLLNVLSSEQQTLFCERLQLVVPNDLKPYYATYEQYIAVFPKAIQTKIHREKELGVFQWLYTQSAQDQLNIQSRLGSFEWTFTHVSHLDGMASSDTVMKYNTYGFKLVLERMLNDRPEIFGLFLSCTSLEKDQQLLVSYTLSVGTIEISFRNILFRKPHPEGLGKQAFASFSELISKGLYDNEKDTIRARVLITSVTPYLDSSLN